MKKSGTSISIVVLLAALCGTAVAQEANTATPAATSKLLVLQSGWIPYGFGTATPTVIKSLGVVYLKGAISSGTSSTAFTLPVGFRPLHTVWLTTNLFAANVGRLVITPDGVTQVQSLTTFSEAQGFTNLDGVSFIP